MTGKKVFIVGAGGFIGTNLTSYLIDEGYHVRAVSRSFFEPKMDNKNLTHITCDLMQIEQLSEHCTWADVVIYLASEGTPVTSNINMSAGAESGIVNSLKFFDLCVQESIGRLIFVSSGGTVYGDAEKIPTPETAKLKPFSAYAINKVTLEYYLALYHKLYSLDYRVLRVSNPYGPYQFANKKQGVIGGFLKSISNNEPIQLWGDGEVVRDYIFIDDLSRAIEACVNYRGAERTFNIGSGAGHSILDVLDVIRNLNIGFDIDRQPGIAAVASSILDVRLAKKELKWQAQIELHEGIKRFHLWFNTLP
jgi:UDP-glucose 4-epimerase